MRPSWKLQELRDTQERMRAKLDAISPDPFSSERLSYCLSAIATFSVEQSSSEHLEIYVAIIQSLLHHSRIGGLRSSEVTRIHQLALKLLNLYRVHPGTSKVVEFHADLSSVMSFVEFSNNRSWISIWDMNVARRLRDKQADDHYRIGNAVRLHKLGFINESKSNYSECLGSDSDFIRRRAILGLVKCARWKNDLSEMSRLIESVESETSGLEDGSDDELKWERCLFKLLSNAESASVIELFSAKHPLYSPVYVLEAMLWCFAHDGADPKSKRPTLLQLQNRRNLRLSTCPEISEVVRSLELCYQSDLDVEQRINYARIVFEQSLQMPGIDAEALSLVALARWLQRLDFPEQLDLVMRRIDGLFRDSPDTEGGLWRSLVFRK